MLVRRELDLGLAVGGPHPGAADLDAPAFERDLTVLVTVPDRGPLRVVLALRAHDVVDLLFHQLAQHAEPDADAQREQSLLRCPNQLSQCLLHALREHGLTRVACATGLPFTAVPP